MRLQEALKSTLEMVGLGKSQSTNQLNDQCCGKKMQYISCHTCYVRLRCYKCQRTRRIIIK